MSFSARLSVASLLVVLAALPASAQDPAVFFNANCAPCHSVGGGEQGGPDLKWVTQRHERQWLIRFMLDPDAMVASGDPRAVDMVKHWDGAVMPKVPDLTAPLAEAILQFIDKKSGDGGSSEPSAAPASPPFSEADIARGRALFTGAVRTQQGAPACITCHAAAGEGGFGGGRLGVDLTLVSTRMRGPQGVAKWLEAPPTPMMRAMVRRSPLTPDENRGLTAFFEDVRTRQPVGPAGQITRVASVGAGGALVAILAMGVVWRNRFRSVRAQLLASAAPSHRPGGES
jgi:mono/diheme cytochrome c family protein